MDGRDETEALARFAETNHVAVATIFRYPTPSTTAWRPTSATSASVSTQHLWRRDWPKPTLSSPSGRVSGTSRPAPTSASVHRRRIKNSFTCTRGRGVGRVYRPTLGLTASISAFVETLAELEPVASSAWADWVDMARQDYLDWHAPDVTGHNDSYVNLAVAIAELRELLRDDAIVSNGAGNYTTWIHRHFDFHQFRTQLATTGGSMGYGLPAALAGKLLYPERDVVALAGDGCFLMTGQELATAVQEQLNVIVIVVNNQMYGTIRLHQERSYPGRPFATDLVRRTSPHWRAPMARMERGGEDAGLRGRVRASPFVETGRR